jgi:hypothetical protein
MTNWVPAGQQAIGAFGSPDEIAAKLESLRPSRHRPASLERAGYWQEIRPRVATLDRRGAIMLRQKCYAASPIELAATPLGLIGHEACVGVHHPSRKLEVRRRDARLMPAKYVRTAKAESFSGQASTGRRQG